VVKPANLREDHGEAAWHAAGMENRAAISRRDQSGRISLMSANRLQRRLPPLNALLAFEAAGRLQNFTAAGRELNITQAAVSRHILTLESHLGALLFTREHRAVQLTPDGARFHQTVAASLEQIAAHATELKRKSSRGIVTIGTTIAFATFWLMPRLNAFRAQEQGIDFKLMASDAPFDLTTEEIDIAIKYGTGEWPGLDSAFLFGDEIFPVCSPAFLARHPAARQLADLPHLPLLHLDDVDASWMNWPAWFAHVPQLIGKAAMPKQMSSRRLPSRNERSRNEDPRRAAASSAPAAPAARMAAAAMAASSPVTHQAEAKRASGIKCQSYNNYSLIIQAAIDGQGIALGWRHFVDDLLREGQLVRPVGATVKTGLGVYLVTARGRPISRPAQRLMQWLRDQVSTATLDDLSPHNRAASRDTAMA
jgi:DNA-binding transcriptional LysR family regulator